jgi:hypothetical protein
VRQKSSPAGFGEPLVDNIHQVRCLVIPFGRSGINFFLIGERGNGSPSTPTPGPVPQTFPRAVFGVTIEQSLNVAQIANLPAIVFRCIEYLETKKADQEEGIYRLSGSSAVIKTLKDRFNTGMCLVLLERLSQC